MNQRSLLTDKIHFAIPLNEYSREFKTRLELSDLFFHSNQHFIAIGNCKKKPKLLRMNSSSPNSKLCQTKINDVHLIKEFRELRYLNAPKPNLVSSCFFFSFQFFCLYYYHLEMRGWMIPFFRLSPRRSVQSKRLEGC